MVGLGEVLWDVFLGPGGEASSLSPALLGGAPANFAVHAAALGGRGVVASAVGADDLGADAIRALGAMGVDTDFVQQQRSAPTGRVLVRLAPSGEPSYAIESPCAWERLHFSEQWHGLARTSDVVAFGTLAQRTPASRAAITAFLDAAGEGEGQSTVVVMDANLRAEAFNVDVVSDGLARAQVLKLNDGECVPLLAAMGASPEPAVPSESVAESVFSQQPGVDLICVTLGENGCELWTRDGCVRVAAPKVAVVDTVGAGDAFTAALIAKLLESDGDSLGARETLHRACATETLLLEAGQFAVDYAGHVCAHAGATPAPPQWALGRLRSR